MSWAHLPLLGTIIWPWPTWPLALTHVTFDLEVKSQWNYKRYDFFSSEFFSSELLSSDFWYSHRQTDKRKAAHKSLPCISTGGLKNLKDRFLTWDIGGVCCEITLSRCEQIWEVNLRQSIFLSIIVLESKIMFICANKKMAFIGILRLYELWTNIFIMPLNSYFILPTTLECGPQFT